MRWHRGWAIQPGPCKNKPRIPQIRRVYIERCSHRGARSSPSQMNLFQKKKPSARRQRFPIPPLLPLICTLYSGGNQPEIQTNALFTFGSEPELYPESRSTSMRIITTFSRIHHNLISETDLGLDFTKWQRKQLKHLIASAVALALHLHWIWHKPS